MQRRDFLNLGAAGVATLVVGRIPGFGIKNAFAATTTLDIGRVFGLPL
jgi:hypothetical protein